MKKFSLLALGGVLFSLLVSGVTFGQTQEEVLGFADVSEEYVYADSIEYFRTLDILRGDDEEGTFRPNGELNRAEFAAILVRLYGVEPTVEEYSNCFPDVKTEWFAPYVCFAKEMGLVSGYEAGALAGMYGPAERLLNAEVVVVLSRLASWEVEEGGEWYEAAWEYAVAHGIWDSRSESFDDHTLRGPMAELIFRTSVVAKYELSVYSEEDGALFREVDAFEFYDTGEEESTQETQGGDTQETQGDGGTQESMEEKLEAMAIACANFDQEYNLPYSSKKNALDFEKSTPAEPGSASPTATGHNVKPIDQGNRGICLAAAVYSSMRWLEEQLGEDFIENGSAGLEELVSQFHDASIDTATKQYDKVVEYLEGLNECIDVEYDTQAGFNVACDELLEKKNEKCDIPLTIRCEKLAADGSVATGDAAESWGHAVDLTDVEVDPDDSNQCSVTFANSWADASNPGTPLDGLGAGRYEKANYNDDTESFDVQSPWGARYQCKLEAAIYICVDEDACSDE